MKKKIVIILVMLLTIITTISVNAEESTGSSITSDEIQVNGFKIKINGIKLFLYETTNKNDDIEVTPQSGISSISESNVSKVESSILDGPDITIELTTDDFSISPESNTRKVSGADTTLIDLNLNITKDKLKSILESKNLNISEEKSYYGEIAVIYDILNLPENYKSVYGFNGTRILLDAFIHFSQEGYNALENYKFQELTNISQSVNAFIYGIDVNTNNPELFYDEDFSENQGNGIYFLNYTLFSENETIGNETEYNNGYYILMFHNIDSIDLLLNSLEENEKEFNEEAKEELIKKNLISKDEVYKIPNTFESLPIYVYVISIISIVIGSVLITNILKEQN